jgi:putative ABC transport system ATP-binding protein
MVALHGPSGSGKTTLLLLIAALLKPERGVIRYRGNDLAAMSENEACNYLLQDVGFIYQRFQLMPRVSAVENAARKLLLGGVGMREAQARAIPWLERVGLGDRLEHPPEKLSGGERQRVAIARALAGEPRLILADEPTGNLDSARSREIVQLLYSIAHKSEAAVLLVTHDLEAAAIADRRCTLRDGRLTDGHSETDFHNTYETPSHPLSTRR